MFMGLQSYLISTTLTSSNSACAVIAPVTASVAAVILTFAEPAFNVILCAEVMVMPLVSSNVILVLPVLVLNSQNFDLLSKGN